MEYFDVYDKRGRWKRRVVRKGGELGKSDYLKIVECWIKNSEGKYLIQKRSKDKKMFSDMWYCSAGGSVSVGEDEREALEREIKEELGIYISQELMKLRRIIVEDRLIFYIFSIETEIDLADIVLQEEEVSDVKWASLDEISQMIGDGIFVKLDYYDKFFGRKM